MAIDYYLQSLGFNLDWHAPPDAAIPICAQVSRASVQILLWTEPTLAKPSRIHIVLSSLAELTAVHEEFQSNNAYITSPPAPRLWGPTAFIVEDLDQNQLFFVAEP
jgi:hypothetical protein